MVPHDPDGGGQGGFLQPVLHEYLCAHRILEEHAATERDPAGHRRRANAVPQRRASGRDGRDVALGEGLRELAGDGLDRPLDVRLDDDVQLLDGACLDLREEVFERDAALAAPRELLRPHALAAELGLAGFVGNDETGVSAGPSQAAAQSGHDHHGAATTTRAATQVAAATTSPAPAPAAATTRAATQPSKETEKLLLAAAQQFGAAISIRPDFVDARVALANLMMDVGNITGANTQLAAALRASGGNPSAELKAAVERWDAEFRKREAATRPTTRRSGATPTIRRRAGSSAPTRRRVCTSTISPGGLCSARLRG